jgi:hypothetical protein
MIKLFPAVPCQIVRYSASIAGDKKGRPQAAPLGTTKPSALGGNDFSALNAIAENLHSQFIVPAIVKWLFASDRVFHGALELVLAGLTDVDIGDMEKIASGHRILYRLLANVAI